MFTHNTIEILSTANKAASLPTMKSNHSESLDADNKENIASNFKELIAFDNVKYIAPKPRKVPVENWRARSNDSLAATMEPISRASAEAAESINVYKAKKPEGATIDEKDYQILYEERLRAMMLRPVGMDGPHWTMRKSMRSQNASAEIVREGLYRNVEKSMNRQVKRL